MIWRALFVLVAASAVMFIWGQIIWPAYKNKPLFPWFDTSKRRAKQALKEAKDQELETRLKIEAEKVKARVAAVELNGEQEVQQQYDDMIKEQERKK